jgi:hypothetical protein
MEVYYPKQMYDNIDIIDMLPIWPVPPSDEKMISETQEAVKKISNKIGNSPIYPIMPNGQIKRKLPLSFIDRFQEFFLVRQWNSPERDPRKAAPDLFRLHRDEAGGGNYSKNCGNYNHFINVVAALSRLIMYFKDSNKIRDLFASEIAGEDEDETFNNIDLLSKIISYETEPDMRTFKLMLAAFYHDIGKTIADPRHGMEGAIIIEDHTSASRYRLDRVVKNYDKKYEFGRDDWMFISDLLLFHDQFGTLSTGEDGYMQLVTVVDRIKRYSLIHNHEQHIWSARYFFDLWLLNIADIIVSLKDKYSLQEKWWKHSSAESEIRNFFSSPISHSRKHDLVISFRLIKSHSRRKHTDDTSALEQQALDYSRRHAVERLGRLITQSIRRPSENMELTNKNQKTKVIVEKIHELSLENWKASIVQCIKSTGDLQEFCKRLSCIGKMDYALGFFQRIAERALKRMAEEIEGGLRTGWISDKSFGKGKDAEDYLYKLQAQFFADNFAATVIQIISYLLFREASIDRLRNIEFSDATKRLNDEKIDKIISLEGPFRARKSTQLILQTIYVY